MKSKPVDKQAHIKSTPPIWVWVCVATFVVILFAIVFPKYRESLAGDELKLLSANRLRIEEFFEVPKQRSDLMRVAAVGTSLLYRGTYYDHVMEPYLNTQGQKNFSFLRVAATGTRFQHFKLIIEELIKHQPDLIVLQVDLFYTRSQPISFSEFFLKQLKVNSKRLTRKLKIGPLKIRIRKLINREEDEYGKKTEEFNPVLLEKYKIKKRNLHYVSLQNLVNQVSTKKNDIYSLLDLASTLNTKVALLIMPRSPDAERVKEELYASLEEVFIADLQNRYQISVLSCPAEFSQEHFFDYGHLNDAGRKLFSEWFGSAAKKLLVNGDMQ